MKAHSSLGASSADRWLNCPGSIRLSAGLPGTSNKYSREGTAAHEVASKCLENGKQAFSMLEDVIVVEDEGIIVTEPMCEAVQIYLDAVREVLADYKRQGFGDGELEIEKRFDLTHIYKGMFGTCDAVVYLPGKRTLYVFDYKHGWISVEAERNPQIMYYALGALTGMHNRPVEHIELVIVQPRSTHNPVKSWKCDPVELMEFRSDLAEGAKKTEHPDALLKPGTWCKFCPASAICPALENKVYDVCAAEFDLDDKVKLVPTPLLSIEKLKTAWENADMIESWIESVKSIAHTRALAGDILPGTKLVRGRRGSKRWKDAESIEKSLAPMLTGGIIKDGLYVTKLKTPTQVESGMTKEQKKLLMPFWEQPEGTLSLVHDSDPRPGVAADVHDEFN